MKQNTLILCTLIALKVSGTAHALPPGAFMCRSDAPYDYLSIDPDHPDQLLVLSYTGKSEIRRLTSPTVSFQSIKTAGAPDLIIQPGDKEKDPDKQGGVNLLRDGRVIAHFDGDLVHWDIFRAGARSRFQVTTSRLYMPHGDEEPYRARLTTRIVDALGTVLAEHSYDDRLGEDMLPGLRFTDDGHGLYQNDDVLAGSAQLEVLDPTTLRTLAKISPPRGGRLDAVRMMTPSRGYVISGNQLLRVQGTTLLAVPMDGGPMKVSSLALDMRSRRLLVEGPGDFAVLDLDGNLLYRQSLQPGVRAGSAKLAIDGSVGFIDYATNAIRIATRASNYRDSVVTPLSKDEWLSVSCFTPRSAALLEQEMPRLVKFPPQPK
ncbi:MAG TPA: hypothetical protein VEP93_01925 [Variovorax sp.]|nr:hypothetical protein [Variovorax sp.]